MYVPVTAISTEFDPNVQSAQDEIHVWTEPLFLQARYRRTGQCRNTIQRWANLEGPYTLTNIH